MQEQRHCKARVRDEGTSSEESLIIPQLASLKAPFARWGKQGLVLCCGPKGRKGNPRALATFAALGTCTVLSDLAGFVFRVAPAAAARTLRAAALTFAAGVGRCNLVFVDCAAQKGLLSIAQRRAIRLSLSTVFSFWLPLCSVSVSVGASRQGRCLVNTPFGTLNHYRAFFKKGRTHRLSGFQSLSRP